MTKSALKEAYLNGGTLLREFGIGGYPDCYIVIGNERQRIRESQYNNLSEDYKIESEFNIIHGGLTKHTFKLKQK